MLDFEQKFKAAYELDVKFPDSNDGLYAIADLMNEREFISIIEQCKDGKKPEDNHLFNLVQSVAFHTLVYFSTFYGNEGHPFENKIAQTARDATIAIKKCVGKLDWSPRFLERYGIETDGEP